MKKIFFVCSLVCVSAILLASSVSDFDNSYIVSLKYNRCIKAQSYPDGNLQPTKMINRGCSIYKLDREHGALTIECPDGKQTIYAKSLDTCSEMLKYLQNL